MEMYNEGHTSGMETNGCDWKEKSIQKCIANGHKCKVYMIYREGAKTHKHTGMVLLKQKNTKY